MHLLIFQNKFKFNPCDTTIDILKYVINYLFSAGNRQQYPGCETWTPVCPLAAHTFTAV